jgi:hypothetical protein
VVGEASVAQAAITDVTARVEPTAQDLALFRAEYYSRERRGRRTDLALGFLFALLVAAAVVYGNRSEEQDARLTRGLYDACQARNATAQQYNSGPREVLVQRAITSPNAPKDQAAKAALAKELRDGLALPGNEDCGPNPG